MQHALAALVSAATTTPTPTPTAPIDPNLVTPGVVGFLFTALIAIAVIFLVWDMMRRIRRGRVRADIQEELDAEAAAQAAEAVEATEVDDENVDAAGDEGDDAAPRTP